MPALLVYRVAFPRFPCFQVRSVPIRKGDEVVIKRGATDRKDKDGKVVQVYRKKWVIHVERVSRDKNNGMLSIASSSASFPRCAPLCVSASFALPFACCT